ncbi:unnamed protein product [Pieris macdunnoughi]|uniref:Uncharacterized protein n=1 Tax=Pieris macdunnoughi TaxID=345717 RepID=A0A821XKU5_9NEOP|nr:unnamed protein product [Pieris macdunnoughi]
MSTFLDLPMLNECDADGIVGTIKATLARFNIPLQNLMGIGTDNASVMTGVNNGVLMAKLRVSWSFDSLKKAIKLIDGGSSMRNAAKVLGILFSSLQKRIKEGSASAPRLGRFTVFSAETEAELANLVKKIANMHFNSPNSCKNSGYQRTEESGSITSWERGKNLTLLCAMNAASGYIPPIFILPGFWLTPLLEKDGPAGALYKCSVNGWIKENLFLEWLVHFVPSHLEMNPSF